jgi:hypothetical protein
MNGEFEDGFSISEISDEVFSRISGVTLPENALIKRSDLRYLRVRHVGFDGSEQTGEIICDRRIADDLLKIFRELFEIRYPIEKIRLADEYGGDDDKIMADNNSSCFNYRCVANTDTLSMHGKGRAVDINPLYNPYIQNGVVMPENAAPYADRTADFEHKITHDDECFKIFAAHGWSWGGDWKTSQDYQHFYKGDSRVVKAIKKVKRTVSIKK